jgi:hypothetical protein
VCPMGVRDLPYQPRLAHAGLPDEAHQLAMSPGGAAERLTELLDLGLAPDEPGETARGGCVKAGAHRLDARNLVDLLESTEALHRKRPERIHLDESFRKAEGVASHQDGARESHLFHAGRQVRSLPDRRVVHPQIASDSADDHLARVQAHADLDGDPFDAPHPLRVAPDRLLHPQRGVTRAHRVVLVRQGRTEQRHNPVTHDLVDRAFEAMVPQGARRG